MNKSKNSIFGFSQDKICDNLTNCELIKCDLDHPRCLVGICISFLKGNCRNSECVLKHPKPSDLKQLQRVSPIMGVFSFNLCKHQSQCLEGRTCKLLHRVWANNLCINNLNDECEEEECPQEHIEWLVLQTKTNLEFNINEFNPENICDSNKQNCQCKNYLHPYWATEMCILNLKGKCRFIKSCTKKHIVWEDFKKDRNIIKMNILTVKPCSQVKLIGAQVEESKTQSLQLYCQNEEEIIKVHRMRIQMKLKYNVDLLIIMDCTGSMSKWIDQAHSTISDIINKVKSKVVGYLFRVAFVGYRDFCDKEKRIVFHDFTEKITDIKEFIMKQKAQGGGDSAEDVIGGLNQGLKLNICKHPESILCTVLIADAPSHGKQYHDENVDDDHNDKIEDGTLEALMKKYKDWKLNNYFTCIGVNKQTDKMYQIMKAEFPTLQIVEHGQPEKFSSVLKYTLKSSIKQSEANVSLVRSQFIINATYKMIEFPPLKVSQKDDEYWQNFPQLLNEAQRFGKTTLRVDKKQLDKISDINYQNGATSYVFKFYDTTNNRYMIGKLPKELVEHDQMIKSALPNSDQYKQLLVDKEEKVKKAKKNSDSRFYSEAYSYQLAKAYRHECKNIKGAPPIFYTPPVIYELEQEFMGTKYMYAETYIDLNYKWKKYTNNARGSSKKHSYYTSFTHFSFQETGGRLMITDLQGKSNILSDPVVHSDKLDVIKDICQNGEAGFKDFTEYQHQICSIICQKLHLNRNLFQKYDADIFLTEDEEVPESKQKYDQKIMQIQDQDVIHIICEFCYEFRQITYLEYQQQIQNSDQIKCKQCIEELKEEFESTCQCCENTFKFNQFKEFRNNRSLPKICYECKIQCSGSSSNKCFYCSRTCNIILKKEKVSGFYEFICKHSRKYLEYLTCNQCNNNFNFLKDKWPSKNQYNNQEFFCYICCNKSK